MKKGYFFLLVSLPLLVFLTSFSLNYAFAEEQTAKPAKFMEKGGEIKERSATRQARIRQNNIMRIKELFTKIIKRYEAALNRLDKIVDKIKRRIEKLKKRGVDTSQTEAALTNCGAKKTAAQVVLADSKAKIAAINPSSATVSSTVQISMDALKSGKKAIRDYHKCLGDVARSMRVLKPKEGTGSAK